jgi:hypothetical protein
MKLMNEVRTENQEIKEYKRKINIAYEELSQGNTIENMLKLYKQYLPKFKFNYYYSC